VGPSLSDSMLKTSKPKAKTVEYQSSMQSLERRLAYTPPSKKSVGSSGDNYPLESVGGVTPAPSTNVCIGTTDKLSNHGNSRTQGSIEMIDADAGLPEIQFYSTCNFWKRTAATAVKVADESTRTLYPRTSCRRRGM
jgi:hypothetical protein